MCGTARRASAGRRGPGFTIIEVMLVVIIIGIAAAVVVPMASSAASMQLRSAANMVAADLEYAKSMSISRARYYTVDFNPSTESYRILDPNGVVIPHPVKKGSDYVVSFPNESRLSKVQIVTTNFNTNSKVKFDYLGTPYNGNGVALTSPGTVTLRAGGMMKVVTVEAVTGFISVSN
jgi:prepilin-type N-terminal cleavage/methylation domain-containing protein